MPGTRTVCAAAFAAAAIAVSTSLAAGEPKAAGKTGEPQKAAGKTPDRISTPRGPLEVIPIDHATFVLRWAGKTIYVDPVGGAGRFEDLPPPDFVLLTDIHGDHLDAPTLKAVTKEKTVLVLPKAAEEALLKTNPTLGRLPRKVLGYGEKAKYEELGIEAVPAYNTTADRKKFHEKGRGNGYVLDFARTRVYISGDTEDIPEMRKLRGIEVAFLCMNLPYTMTMEQAASAVLEFKPRIVYPYHSKGQDTTKFKALVEEKSKEIDVRLRDWYPKR
jgi:L-ascorbate metabolism protein UlaG (beta-lactamase superfamily)